MTNLNRNTAFKIWKLKIVKFIIPLFNKEFKMGCCHVIPTVSGSSGFWGLNVSFWGTCYKSLYFHKVNAEFSPINSSI